MKLILINGFQGQRPVTIICLNKNGPMVLSVANVAMVNTGSAQEIFISAPSVSTSIL
jgi:hypothetical protein